MPDEGTGVNGAGSPYAQQGVNSANSPNAQNQPGTGDAAGATDQTGSGGSNEPGPVPYGRFREVNERLRAAEARAAATEALARQIAAQNTDLQTRLSRPAQPSGPEADPEMAALEQVATARLGNDETAQQARETIAAIVQIEMKKALKGAGGKSGLGQDEVTQIVTNIVSQAMAPNAIQSQLNQWKADGRISEEDIPAVSQEMQEMISAQPAWGQGENLKLLPIVALGQVVAKGRLSKGQAQAQKGPDGTPLQPGGPSSPVRDAGDAQRVAEEVVARFPRLAGLDPSKLAERYRKNPMDPYHGEVVFSGRK